MYGYMEHVKFPIIDIRQSPGGQSVGGQIYSACQEYGAFYISGHGLSVVDLFKLSVTFFNQGIENKNKISINTNDLCRGYEPQTEKASKEGFVIGTERKRSKDTPHYHGPNTWPDKVPALRPEMMRVLDEMMGLSRLLHEYLALGLGVDRGYFANISHDPNVALRLLHYPPHQKIEGIEEHTDWGGMTLLISDGCPGLEVKNNQGVWCLPEPEYACDNLIMIHPGNLIARWTNDTVKALSHRVVNRGGESRYSIAFFMDMDHDTIIDVLPKFITSDKPAKYAPISVSDYLEEMHNQDYG